MFVTAPLPKCCGKNPCDLLRSMLLDMVTLQGMYDDFYKLSFFLALVPVDISADLLSSRKSKTMVFSGRRSANKSGGIVIVFYSHYIINICFSKTIFVVQMLHFFLSCMYSV